MGDDVSEPLSPSRAGGTLVDCFPDAIVTLLVNTINKQANTQHTLIRLTLLSDSTMGGGSCHRIINPNLEIYISILIFFISRINN